MQIIQNADLAPFHTFSITSTCDYLVEATSIEDLIAVYERREWADLPKLPLGAGSNVLFTEHFSGVVILNRLKGKKLTQDSNFYYLECAAGEDWPELVEWSVNEGVDGLENLALIPGCVGSAPIQNIGAYGVELKKVCDFVEYLDLKTMSLKRLTVEECLFGYRESIFKRSLAGKALIVKVGIKLAKSWKPSFEYGALKEIVGSSPTAKSVFDAVCEVRRSKLPDPKVTGNAGSFFKNPVISFEHYHQLKDRFPKIVGFPSGEGFKVAAGWLIDNAGLKGYTSGGARVHDKQALVIVNFNHATAQDVLDVAQHVKTTVVSKYGIELEHEVRFMGRTHETDLATLSGNEL